MKKAIISIPYDEEKLAALRVFLTQKDLDLDKELGECLEKLFSRYVPQNVRDYLDLKDVAAPVIRKTIPKSPPQEAQTKQGNPE
jgi:hypothetical protein